MATYPPTNSDTFTSRADDGTPRRPVTEAEVSRLRSAGQAVNQADFPVVFDPQANPNQQSFFRWLCVLILGMCVLGGCTSVVPTTPVPGAATYCIGNHASKEMYASLLKSSVEYGPHKRYTITGGAGWLCDLNRFHTLSVKFETKDGQRQDLTFDLVQIMRKFQDETPGVRRDFSKRFGSARVEVLYHTDRIDFVYRISEYNKKGATTAETIWSGITNYEFPILTYRLPSVARQP